MLLIGSQALKRIRPDLLLREPRDWDYICTWEELIEWSGPKNFDKCYEKKPDKWVYFFENQIYEFEVAREGGTAWDLMGEIRWDHQPLDLLYTLKMSHRFLKDSPHFLKTMRGIQKMRAAGAEIPAELAGWFKRREKETYNYAKPNLNQGSKSFFNPNQGVNYKHDHDTIHLALARDPGKPAYDKFKHDLAEVKVSKEKFFGLDFETQINSVLEESYVLAIERSQVPFPGLLTPRQSFLKALEKVCTSISSGWWREWAWENYDRAVARYDGNYLRQFEEGVKSGIVKPFDGNVRHMEKS